MLEIRYEEYPRSSDCLPFVLRTGITVTPETRSAEPNWHDNLEIQLCTSGCGWVTLDEKTVYVKKNDITVVNSGVLHHISTENTIKYDSLIIDTQFCRQFGINPPEVRFCQTPGGQLAEYFSRLVNAYECYTGKCRTAELGKILLDLLIELRENHTVAENVVSDGGITLENVKKTIKYIRENYPEKLSLDDIAGNAMTDKYALSREFKRSTRYTVFQYLNGFRCKMAAEYISEGKSVSEAATLCGFGNMSFFTKTFKKYMGCLPSKYINDDTTDE